MLKNENNSILFFKHLLKVALSQIFFILVQIQKKMVANHGPENYFFRWIVFSDFAPFLGDLGHSENLFEIIPPLSRNDSNINNDVVCTTYICRCTIYYTLICKVFALSYPLNVQRVSNYLLGAAGSVAKFAPIFYRTLKCRTLLCWPGQLNQKQWKQKKDFWR